MNMGRMCYVFEAPAVSRRVDHMGRMCYVFEAPAVSRRVDHMGRMCYVLEAPAVSRRDDPPGRVGRLRGSGPCGFTNPLFPSSMVSEGSECGIRAS